MAEEKSKVRTVKGIREYTCLGCPLTRNRTAWCFRLCTPDEEGHGRCGRIAPHALKGRTQLSVERYGQKRREAHYDGLEQRYLAAPCNEFFDAGVRISEGAAELVLEVQPRFLDAGNVVHASVGFTALADSARLAVNSLVQKSEATAVQFEVQFAGPLRGRELIARSRFVGMSGPQYLAESILLDEEGREIGSAKGVFAE